MTILDREALGIVGSTLHAIREGAAGISDTLNMMVRLARIWKNDPSIRSTAERIIADVAGKDFRGEVEAVQNWVRDNIRYTMDVRDVETLKTPYLTLTTYQGDCDDQSLLVATLLESIGYKTRFVAIGFEGPNSYSHVFAEVLLGTRWVAVETTENVELGWKPAGISVFMTRHV